MLPAVAIVGRPNVGKSTLFNHLTSTRDALVADFAGLTRDRRYGYSNFGPKRCIVVDTGGLSEDPDELMQLTIEQATQAIEQAQVIVFLVDGREGVNAADENLAEKLRRFGKPIVLAVNKTDTVDATVASAEFHALGIGEPHAIAATNGRGVRKLWHEVCDHFMAVASQPTTEVGASIKVAIVGRPNVGKSTFVNTVLGEQRVIAHQTPGTTRDSVHIVMQRGPTAYTLIDTAGIRRRPKVSEAVEKFSVVKTLQAIDHANVCVVLIDGDDAVTDQDARLLGLVLEAGKGLVVGVNKWDRVDKGVRDTVRREVERKTAFIDFADVHYVSAAKGWGVAKIFRSIDQAWRAAQSDLPTPELTRVLAAAIEQHPPPLVRGRRIKLKYAHQGGVNPPVIVVHGNQTESVPDAYTRYLTKFFRTTFNLQGTPVRVEFRTGASPYAGRRNTMTERQRERRQRMINRRKS